MATLKRKSWPVSSHCVKETKSPHRGSISGRHRSSAKILSLRPNSYAHAKGWDDLVHVFTESLQHSSLDEMILLVHATIPGPYERRSKYVRPVTYNTLDEIPRLLLSMVPGASRTDTIPAHQERQRVEVATGVQPDGDKDGQAQQEHDGKEVEAVAAGRDHEEEIDETRVNAAKVIQDAYRHHLEQKRAGAARKIQATYRRYLKRKSVVLQGVCI